MAANNFFLYVNLGASQARKRLKGRGLGVKRVESAGNQQAVVIHTATGKHFEQLKAVFRDVLSVDSNDEQPS